MITSRKPTNYIFFIFVLICLLPISGCKGQRAEQEPAGFQEEAIDSALTTVVDQMQNDHQAPAAETSDVEKAVVVSTPTPAVCNEEHGRIEQHVLQSSLLGKELAFRVYLPPCYDMPPGYYSTSGHYYSDNWRYPLLVLMHGQTFTDDQWERIGVAEAADSLISTGESPPFLIVMPYEEDDMQDSSQSVFGRAIAEELLPWMDEQYSTCTQRMCRAVGGLSRGGSWALQLGLSRWDLFASVGSHSTPPFQGYPVSILNWMENIPEGQLPRLYMDAGKGDIFLPNIQELETYLTQVGVPHEWVLADNGDHSETYWQTNVETYLRWHTVDWRQAVFGQ